MTHLRHLPTLSLLLLLAACGGSNASQRAATRPIDTGAAAQDTRGTTVATSGADTGDARCQVAPVYFSFDSADLTAQMRDTLAADAHCLQTHPELPVDLVGATDPRGTEEYNLALGDRRARAVASYLESLGVPTTRVHVTSVGEEEARGSDEHSWAEDRFVKDR